MLGIYAFPAIKNINLKQKTQETTLTPVDGLVVRMAMKGEKVDGDNDDGGGDRVPYRITCRTS